MEFVKGQIKELFNKDWPMVYGNLGVGAYNCFFDRTTGNLLGCSNWSRLDICPFGVSEAAIDLFLGYKSDERMRRKKQVFIKGSWVLVENYAALKRFFFAELKREIKRELKWEPDDRLHVALALGQLLHIHHSLQSLTHDGKLPQLPDNDEIWLYLDVLMRGFMMTEEERPGRFWDDSIDFWPSE